ncbi:transposase [Streptomyces sp. NPDC056638]|uniref:transposase n=1 Tax=Streptomyces sp. NPDC056638 TaxID=3345887 RepID=UPI00369944A7
MDRGSGSAKVRGAKKPDRSSVGRVGDAAASGRKPGRPPQHSGRKLIVGIRIRTRTGVLWRDVPERYGSTSTPSSRRGPTPVA